MKKILTYALTTVLFLTLTLVPASVNAISCDDACPAGTYKSKISGTDICECLTNNSGGDPEAFAVTDQTLDEFDPLVISGSKQAERLSTFGGIISRLLEFAFPLAGMILFVMIVVGGFQMLTGAAGQKGLEEGRKKVTTAILGFLLLFSAYWIAQLLELVFNIQIL